MFDITLKAIYKGLKIAKVFPKKNFELQLNNKAGKWISFLMLDLSMTYRLSKTRNSKEDPIWFYCLDYVKIIFILLVDFIVLYMRIIQINLRKTIFKGLFSKVSILWKPNLILLILKK